MSYVCLGFEDFLQVKERHSYGAAGARLNPEGGMLYMRDSSGKQLALDTL